MSRSLLGLPPHKAFQQFLANSKQSLLAHISGRRTNKSLHLVLGNEAGDADSAVGALAHAFFLHQTKPSFSAIKPDIITPLINVHRDDILLRQDVVHMFREAHVNLEDITFISDVNLELLAQDESKQRTGLSISLVDHNALSHKQSFLQSYVKEIVDHHKDEQQYISTTMGHRTIQTVGSCCSLIASQYATLPRADRSSLLQPALAWLLYGVILLDTGNMSAQLGKGTDTDRSMLDYLSAVVNNAVDEPVSASDLYQTLSKKRTDISALTSDQLLRKDLKEVVVSGVKGPGSQAIAVAVASVPSVSIAGWLKRDSHLLTVVADFARKRACGTVLVMTAYTCPDTNLFKRDLLIAVDNEKDFAYVTNELERADELQLRCVELPEAPAALPYRCRAYSQLNVKASRKQVLPIITGILKASM